MVVDMEEFLSGYRGKNMVFVPNAGNAGDALIAYATLQLLGKLGIDHELGTLSGTYVDRVVVLGGGGNLVEPYRDAINFIGRHARIVRDLVILPHTVRSYAPILGGIEGNASIICRDFESFEYCRKNISGNVKLYLSDDMAFKTDVGELFREGGLARKINGRKFLSRNFKRRVHEYVYRARNLFTPSVLNSFREDVERTAIALPFSNIDVSHSHSLDRMQRSEIIDCVYSMFNFINRFEVVNTNRLHICISGLPTFPRL